MTIGSFYFAVYTKYHAFIQSLANMISIFCSRGQVRTPMMARPFDLRAVCETLANTS